MHRKNPDNARWLAIVPANCTDRLQPLDVSVNKPAKEFLRRKSQQWYSEEVHRQIENGKAGKVDLAMSIVKPLGAQWLIDLNEYMQSNPSIIINGFNGILQVVKLFFYKFKINKKEIYKQY